MVRTQIYASLIRHSLETKAVRELYAFFTLKSYSLDKRGYVPMALAIRELSKRLGISSLTVRKLLTGLSNAGWITIYRDTNHIHVKSIDKIKLLVSPDGGSVTYTPNARAMKNLVQFEAWCIAAIADYVNHIQWDRGREKREWSQRDHAHVIRPARQIGTLEAESRRKDTGDISVRYLAKAAGISVARAWRLRKLAGELGFIKITPRYDEDVDAMSIRTVEQLNEFVDAAGYVSGNEDIHKHRFVWSEEMKRYRMMIPFLVDTSKLVRGRRKLRKEVAADYRRKQSIFLEAGLQFSC